MTCPACLAGGPLHCQRTDPHSTGHVFVSTSGVRHMPKEDALVLSGRRGRQS